MTGLDDGLYAALTRRGMSRRAFLRFSAAMAAALALPAGYAPRIAAAVEAAPRLPVIWLRGQACGGDSAAFMSAPKPTVAELLLDLLSVRYDEAFMVNAGGVALQARTDAMARFPGGYLAVVEGAIPSAQDGMACTVGGRPFGDVVREVGDGAIATIAVGSCAFDGGAPGANGGPTAARGVGSVLGSGTLVNLPGCPVNVENLAATIVHFLTFGQMPVTDSRNRPLFAYGGLLHNQCERRAHFEFGEFVLAWGDEGAQKGWCLYKMGCKGPETYANCPTALYASATSWAVKAGHGCIGCTMPSFWDAMGPAYSRLPSPLPFASNVTADQVGLALVGGVAALTAAHGAISYARERWVGAVERRRAVAAAARDAAPAAVVPAALFTGADVPAPVRSGDPGTAVATAAPDTGPATEWLPDAPEPTEPGLPAATATPATEPAEAEPNLEDRP